MALTPQISANIASAMQRRNRYPQHPLYLRHQAMQLQPFLLSPVLPGETLKQALIQTRVVTDPLLDPLCGWWIEYYFWYVKHRDLISADNGTIAVDLQEMMLDVNKNMSAHFSAADFNFHHSNPGSINYTKHCLIRCTEEYFRDEGEAWNTFANANGLPRVSISGQSAMQSLMPETVDDTADVGIVVGADDTITASEIEAAQREYEFMRLSGITNLSYEDYLASYGISTRAAEQHKPELLRYIREWTYPSNTVDPVTGAPTSACSWAIQERISKPRLFREPGWIFGATVARPKLYSQNSRGAWGHEMFDAFTWLPAALMGEASHSIKHYGPGLGPHSSSTAAYMVDLRDLLIYGDQFTNFDQSTTSFPKGAIPTSSSANTRYPTEADVTALFKTGAANKVKQDGVVSLTIAGMQTDLTPSNRA